jgi:hypothetical protein
VTADFLNVLFQVHAKGAFRSLRRHSYFPKGTQVQLAALAAQAVSAIIRMVDVGNFLTAAMQLIVSPEQSGYHKIYSIQPVVFM